MLQKNKEYDQQENTKAHELTKRHLLKRQFAKENGKSVKITSVGENQGPGNSFVAGEGIICTVFLESVQQYLCLLKMSGSFNPEILFPRIQPAAIVTQMYKDVNTDQNC